MTPLAVVVVIQLILTTTILGLSSHPRALTSTKHQLSKVLGAQQLAQVDKGAGNSSTTTPDQPSTDTSTPATDNTSSPASNPPADTAPTSAPAPTATDTNPNSTPTDQSSPSDSSANQPSLEATPPSESPGLFDQQLNPAPSEAAGTNPNQPNSSPASSTPTQTDTGIIQTQAVLSPDELVNSPENINTQSVAEAKKEEEQLSQTPDPTEQTKLLVSFATDKVKDMSNFTKSDDFSSTSFAAQRFNSQMDQAISNLDKLPQKDQAPLRQQLSNFCNQADQVLRTVELSVPEAAEQDIQMARGQCQELKL